MKVLLITLTLLLSFAARADYQLFYPTYVEVCALSQKEKVGNEREKPWGHSLMFIRGACKDHSSKIPLLKTCAPGPDSGVMVSVNSLTKNVNWIASESESYGFFGGLQPNESLDEQRFNKAVKAAVDNGLFSGVEIYEDRIPFARPSQMSLEEAGVRTALDIDTAITFGRDAYCARLPLNEPTLDKLVNWLNSQNKRYAKTKLFSWHYLYNNCGHLVHNALSALGLWDLKRTDASLPYQLFNLSIPANELINVMELGNETELNDPVAIFKLKDMREALLERNWLPVRHGVMFRKLKRHEPNQLYKGDLSIYVFDLLFSSANRSRFNEFSFNPIYQDLKANLTRYKDIYEKALSQIEGNNDSFASATKDLSEKEQKLFPFFLKQYRSYLQEQLADVEKKLLAVAVPQS